MLTKKQEREFADALLLVRNACLGPSATAEQTIRFCVLAMAREVQFFQIVEAEIERPESPATLH